jgi:hypothetical protein
MDLAPEQRYWVKRSSELHTFEDSDGIVCVPAVRGEATASDRLLEILVASYGKSVWSNDVMLKLLNGVGFQWKTLEDWLRNGFFSQHCALFRSRPFIWNVWDGMRDGFSAFINCHKLTYKNLEILLYTYLGDWINRQSMDMSNGVSGAEERLAAAYSLKSRLEAILLGEKPYDIYVRWKPIEGQPVGWNPDINDGVRVNIRPFMEGPDLGRRGAGILKDKPKIDWRNDNGLDNDPASPWYDRFKGRRVNDVHLSLSEKTGNNR